MAPKGCAAALWGVSPAGRECPTMRLQPPPSPLLWGSWVRLCVRRQATWASGPASPGSPLSGTRDPADTTTWDKGNILQSAYSAAIGSKTWLHETYPLKVCLCEQEGSLGFRQRVSVVNEASHFKARTRQWAPA